MFQDLHFGVRMLLKSKGFTLIVVLSLALGIGANSAIFSLIDAVLLKALPVKNPEQLFFIERGGVSQGPKRSSNISYTFFDQLRARHDVLAGVCAFAGISLTVRIDGEAEFVQGQRVSGGFFEALGVHALLGRTLTEDDDKIPGGHPVAVISYNYWQRRFARDPAIVGKTIEVNGYPFTIIGVTTRDFF